MALTLKIGKTAVRFEFADDEAETTVTLFADDDEQTLVRKLKRVIGLVEPGLVWEPLDRLKRLTQAEVAKGAKKGFPAMKPPEIPERLKGEIEMDEGPAAPVVGNGWGDGPPSA